MCSYGAKPNGIFRLMLEMAVVSLVPEAGIPKRVWNVDPAQRPINEKYFFRRLRSGWLLQ